MPSIRTNKHAPTDTTSDADAQPESRKSSRLVAKGPRKSPTSASGVSKSRKSKSAGKGKGKPKASVKAEPSATDSAPPPPPVISSIASPPRPILRVKTDLLPPRTPASAHKCCLLRGPCLVCFSHESLLTPLFSATFPKRDWFPVQPSLAGRVMTRPSPTRVGQLRPAVWSPTASQFDCDEYLYTPRTPHFQPAKDLYAQSYMPEPDLGSRPHAEPQANILYGLQNVYRLPNLFTAFSLPTSDSFDPFRLATDSGVKPIFTHIVRILQVSDAIATDQSLQQIFVNDPESGSRTVVVHTIITKDDKLSTGRQFHEVMHFLSAHLASESRPGLVDQFAAPPEHGRTRVLILAPFKKDSEEEESSPSLALVASPNEGSDDVFWHGHIAPPPGAVIGSFVQRVNLLSVVLLALCKVTADKEHLMRTLRSHLAMARTGRADAQLDDDDEVLINHLPWDTLLDVMRF